MLLLSSVNERLTKINKRCSSNLRVKYSIVVQLLNTNGTYFALPLCSSFCVISFVVFQFQFWSTIFSVTVKFQLFYFSYYCDFSVSVLVAYVRIT